MENLTGRDIRPQVNIAKIIVYYLLACAISWPFFWWRDMHRESFIAWNLPFIIKTWSYMWGPGLAAIIISLLWRAPKESRPQGRVTLFGTSVTKSLLFWFVPFLMLAVPGLPNKLNINPHLFPILAMSLLGFISIIGEDSGWSYFLKNELLGIHPVKRAVIIGIMWELWHFTNRTAHKPLLSAVFSVAFMAFFLILLTYFMGWITDRTKSLVTAVTIHMWINVLTENGCTAVYIVFGLSLLFWTGMFLYWNKPLLRSRRGDK